MRWDCFGLAAAMIIRILYDVTYVCCYCWRTPRYWLIRLTYSRTTLRVIMQYSTYTVLPPSLERTFSPEPILFLDLNLPTIHIQYIQNVPRSNHNAMNRVYQLFFISMPYLFFWQYSSTTTDRQKEWIQKQWIASYFFILTFRHSMSIHISRFID